jgi:hypothetical protein
MDSVKKTEVSQEKKTLAELSEIELKAAVYDQTTIIADAQKNIRILNEEIARRAQSKK